ncbi:MAG: hypothetical protein HQL45_02840 [Alphaproteobacteria bacterium]|nr:hypothetical protein [Alphaproteobacteria bacterium]
MTPSRQAIFGAAIISFTCAGLIIGQQINEIISDRIVDAEFCAPLQETEGLILPIPWGPADICNLDLQVVCMWFLIIFVASLIVTVPLSMLIMGLCKRTKTRL